VVTYMKPPAVEVVTQKGKWLHRLDNTSAGRELFIYPWNVTVSGDRVFVSDWGTNTITMLSDQFQLLATFSQPDLLEWPYGIISLNDDQLLVCGMLSNNIVLLQPSSGRMSAILEKKDGVEIPQALGFCHHSHCMGTIKASQVVVLKDTVVVTRSTKTHVNSMILILKLNMTSMRNIYIKSGLR